MIETFLFILFAATVSPEEYEIVVYEEYEATAYSCEGITDEAQRLMNCPNGITTSGTKPGKKTAACSRDMLGRSVHILELDEVRKCEDTGGAIGPGEIDLYAVDISAALRFGRQKISVTII